MAYIERAISDILKRRVQSSKCLLLTGARQVGKSTLIKHEFSDYNRVSFDDKMTRLQAKEEPKLFFLNNPKPLFIDEVQKENSIFDDVKALVDVNALNATTAGTYTLENVKLIAYDEKGTEIKDIEIIPETVTATVEVTSPSKVVPVIVVPIGDVASGSAIGSITSNVSTVTLYGDEDALKAIEDIKVNINVSGLSKDKSFQETIVKPNGVRSMSDTAITIKVTMEGETSKEFKDIPLEFENLDTTKYRALAKSESDTKVNVVVKGVSSLLNKLTAEDIKAYVDLSDLEAGTYEVPVIVTGNDLKLKYSSRTIKIEVVISKK